MVLAAAFALSTNAIVALMQVPAAAVAPARQYLFICACGLVFITGYNMVSGVLRGLGDSKRPMYFVLVACIINIVGDLLLVGVFGLGAAGAALATVAAQGVSLALVLAVHRRRDFPFDFKRRSFRIQGDKAARILRLGLPVAVQNVLVTLVFTLNGFYSGCGRTGFTLFNSLASTFLVRVPAVFSSACSPVSLCCTSVWPRRRPPPSRCSSSSSTSAPAGGTTRFWGRRRHDRRSAGLPGRRSGPHFPL